MDSPSKQSKTVSPSQKIRNLGRLRKFNVVIEQLTKLGIPVDEPNIKYLEKYEAILKNDRYLRSLLNNVRRNAHKGMEKKARQRKEDEENERLREEQENKPLDQCEDERFEETPRLNPL